MKPLHFLPTWFLQNLEIVNEYFYFHGNTVICISSTWLYYQSFDWQIIIENDVHKVRCDPAALRSKQGTLYGVHKFSSVQLLSRVRLFVTLWTAARQASLSITNSQSLLKFMSIELVMPSNYLILRHPLLLPPSIIPSIRVFSDESVLHIRLSKYWSFSFSISPSSEYSGLISFRMDWLPLLAVQGTLKSLLQHHSSKASVLQHSAFLIVSHIHTWLLEKP